MKRFLTVAIIGTAFLGQVANAGSLIDGSYIGPEEEIVVRGGKLYKCFVNGVANGPCKKISATQVGKNAIRMVSTRGDDYLLCKDPLPPGTNAIFARCTPNGWKRN